MIEIVDVAKSFGDLDVLDGVNITIGDGEFVSLVGASGSGKTTLLRIVAGLEPPTAGAVLIDDSTPAEMRAMKRLGLVPQSPALLPWRSVYDNARLLLDLNPSANPTSGEVSPDERVRSLLDEVGLDGFLDAYPHELSGGMQQRVALVRAFALDARVLLLDEPFAALDELTRAEMRHLLARLVALTNATVLFVTHSLNEAVFLSDRVGVMSERPGTIAALQPIDLPTPREPEVEDSSAFFDQVRSLRHALRAARGSGAPA